MATDNPRSDLIERAGKRGAEIVSILRPFDAGQIASAVTRRDTFVDPTLDPETGYPVEPVATDYFMAGGVVGQSPIKP